MLHEELRRSRWDGRLLDWLGRAGGAGGAGGAQAGARAAAAVPGRRLRRRQQRMLQLPEARSHGARLSRQAGASAPSSPKGQRPVPALPRPLLRPPPRTQSQHSPSALLRARFLRTPSARQRFPWITQCRSPRCIPFHATWDTRDPLSIGPLRFWVYTAMALVPAVETSCIGPTCHSVQRLSRKRPSASGSLNGGEGRHACSPLDPHVARCSRPAGAAAMAARATSAA